VQDVEIDPVTDPESTRGVLNAKVAAVFLAVGAFIPRLLTAGHHLTYDELVWMRRTARYSDALTTLDLAGMTAARGDQVATLPGVPTMIVGSVARFFYGAAQKLGVVSDEPFARAWTGLQSAQIAVAIATSLLIGLLVLLTWQWLGALPAMTAGFFLATEPLLAAHGAVLHTDELLGLFGACTVVLLARLLGRGGPPLAKPTMTAVLAGVLAGLTVLTKLSALAFAPGAVLLTCWVAWRRVVASRRTERGWRSGLGSVFKPVALVCLAGVATIAVLWPAIVVAPGDQLGVLRSSAKLADAGQFSVFRDEITFAPSGLFYFVTAPFRMTPWFMLATLILVPLGFSDRRRRQQFLTLVLFIATVIVVLTVTPKKIDRYIIEIVPLLTIAVGIGAARLVDLLRPGHIGAIGIASARRFPQALSIAAVAALVAATGYSIHVSPWGGIYFNPLLGGSDRAEALLVVGWGEGIRGAGDIIAEREAGSCDDITVAMAFPYFDQAITCGRATQTGNPADYRIIYINDRQLDLYGKVAEFRANHTPVGVVEERGIVLAEVYDLRQVD
jgi:hypothetical protein